jgi:hypothetical protein
MIAASSARMQMTAMSHFPPQPEIVAISSGMVNRKSAICTSLLPHVNNINNFNGSIDQT